MLYSMRSGLACLCMSLLLWAGSSHAASSVLISPIDPVLSADQQATALWLENKGDAPINLQVRVLAWEQVDFDDRYVSQRDVVGIPQVARVEAGQKQLIRITRLQPAVAGVQQAFRVIIDELPQAEEESAGQAEAGVRFTMRYLIPLFSYGAGMGGASTKQGATSGPPQDAPVLHWQQVKADGISYLQLHNGGRVHARLTDVSVESAGKRAVLFEGLMGYVLPGATMRWPLPQVLAKDSVLTARVNGGAATPLTAGE